MERSGQADATADAAIGAGGPVAVRMRLGARLRQLREVRGVSREEAAALIRSSVSKISRMELGQVGFKERDVADLLTLYQVAGSQRDELLGWARLANQPGWWHGFRNVASPWLRTYLGLETAATLIRTYQSRFVPALLQTRPYAAAVVRLGRPGLSEVEVARRVGLVMRRQQEVLGRLGAPRLWAVLDEAVLHRQVGGRAVMREQLEALAGTVGKESRVRLQVIRFKAGRFAPAGGSFTILRFPGEQLPDVAYVEQLTGGLRIDKRGEVERYGATVGRLYADAAPPHQTVEIVDQVLAGLRVPGR